MEVICDYFRNGYKVLHNLDSTRLAQANDIVQYIEPLVKGKNKLLIAIDNAHDKKMTTIFNVINQLSYIDNSKDVLFVVTARLPEYDTLVGKRLLELDDLDRIALKKFNETPNIRFLIPYFRDAKEVDEFFTFYKTNYNLDKSSPKSYLEIFNETNGHPIMVKFFLLGKGLREDVENKYKFYLFDLETKKPVGENIQTMLICALFSIANYTVTTNDLDEMRVKRHAKRILGILHTVDGKWTTIHPRWDMELFSYLFSSKDEDEIDDRKKYLGNACSSIFELHEKVLSLSVLSTLYEMASESRIPINIVNDVVRIPSYIANDNNAMYSIHAYDKTGAYYNLGLYDEMLFECNEAISKDENGVDALNNKGFALYNLGRYEEAIKWYDKALEIDPNYVKSLNNKGIALKHLGKYHEAIEEYDKALKINPDYVDAMYNKGLALGNLGKYYNAIEEFDRVLRLEPNYVVAMYDKGLALGNLGKHQEAIVEYDKALEIDPNYVDALHNKGSALGNLGKHQEAIVEYDKALEIDPNYFYALNNKGLALSYLGRYKEALEWYDKALDIEPDYVIAWDNKSLTLIRLNRLDEAIQCWDKAIQLDPSYANAWYNRSCSLAKKGELNEALKNLEEAIRLDNTNIESAKTDNDFDLIRTDERFKKLIAD